MTYKDAEYGLTGVVMEVLGSVGDGNTFYELAKSYHFANNAGEYPSEVELCRVFWLQADHVYMEFVHDLEIISEGR